MSASNVLRSKCGTPVYMGAVAQLVARQYGELLCSLRVAAPEMLQNRPYNESVDIWAAGILLYIMCATDLRCRFGR
jgi:serine/threonine protein kinase